MFGKDLAEKAAERILNKYQNGIAYTETEWVGSPRLELSSKINCCGRYDVDESKEYILSHFECVSNEFTLDGGLRMKSKLRRSQ